MAAVVPPVVLQTCGRWDLKAALLPAPGLCRPLHVQPDLELQHSPTTATLKGKW